MTRVWRSSHRLSEVNTGVVRKKGPYRLSMPGHLINSLVTKDLTRLLLRSDQKEMSGKETTVHVLVQFQLQKSWVDV